MAQWHSGLVAQWFGDTVVHGRETIDHDRIGMAQKIISRNHSQIMIYWSSIGLSLEIDLKCLL